MGTCDENERSPGGWATVIPNRDQGHITRQGRSWNTTLEEMRLTAAINGLQALPQIEDPRRLKMTLHTSSSSTPSTRVGVNHRKHNGWRHHDGKPVADPSLWMALIGLANPFRILSITWKYSPDSISEHCLNLAKTEAERNNRPTEDDRKIEAGPGSRPPGR